MASRASGDNCRRPCPRSEQVGIPGVCPRAPLPPRNFVEMQSQYSSDLTVRGPTTQFPTTKITGRFDARACSCGNCCFDPWHRTNSNGPKPVPRCPRCFARLVLRWSRLTRCLACPNHRNCKARYILRRCRRGTRLFPRRVVLQVNCWSVVHKCPAVAPELLSSWCSCALETQIGN